MFTFLPAFFAFHATLATRVAPVADGAEHLNGLEANDPDKLPDVSVTPSFVAHPVSRAVNADDCVPPPDAVSAGANVTFPDNEQVTRPSADACAGGEKPCVTTDARISAPTPSTDARRDKCRDRIKPAPPCPTIFNTPMS
jgi:hypothetical protein